jgi:starvation-inducible DNA-binding protein
MATTRKSESTASKSRNGQKNGQTRMFQSRHDLEEEVRQQMVELCNRQLADTFDLYSQNKQAHWNVKGRDFFQLHELFDRLAEEVLPFVDMIAERATALGGQATGTAKMAAASSRLTDLPLETVEGMPVVEAMAGCYAVICQNTREAIEEAEQAGDMDTADLFTEISRELDKHLYFLESHLQGAER